MAAIVATELAGMLMVGKAHITVFTVGHPGTISAGKIGCIAPAVLEKDDLLACQQRLSGLADKIRRKLAFARFALPHLLHIHHLDDGG